MRTYSNSQGFFSFLDRFSGSRSGYIDGAEDPRSKSVFQTAVNAVICHRYCSSHISQLKALTSGARAAALRPICQLWWSTDQDQSRIGQSVALPDLRGYALAVDMHGSVDTDVDYSRSNMCV